MFTPGRIIFTIFFSFVFIIALIYAYRKEITVRRIHFKGTYLIFLTIIVIFTTLFLIVKLRN